LLRVRRLALIMSVAVAGIASALVVAAPQSARPAKLAVGVSVLHFNAGGRKQTATGLVTAKLTDNTGRVATIHTTIAITAATASGCKILHLYLKQLDLHLLGLNVHLDKVVLDITGNKGGGVLGSLFCKLANAKVASARASAARALNARLTSQHVLRMNTNITPTAHATAAGQTCPVLDLLVGPLNVQLLGLVVNLNQVHLTITATNGAGVLGDLFCKLANSTTVTPTTTT
jgi:hypothetical protein